MFELEYCDNPKEDFIKNSGLKYDDSIALKYEKACNVLDNYIYLIDMFRIIESCANDLLNVEISNKEYWKVNKALLNYVNAVYSFKEFTNNFNPSIKAITENFYNNCKWYRFVCDFRNSVIHDSVISTDYGINDAYIIIDKLIDIQKHRTVKSYQENNRNRQIQYLENMKADAKYWDGKYFYGIKKICRYVSSEIKEMKEEVLLYSYNKSVTKKLKWLFNLLYKIDGKIKYVFIVNKEKGPNCIYEPNYTLENFIIKIRDTLGETSEIYILLKKFFDKNEYIEFFW